MSTHRAQPQPAPSNRGNHVPEATFRPVVPQNLVAVEGMLDDGDRPTLLAKNSIFMWLPSNYY